MHLGPFSKAGQVTGSVRPNGKGRLMAGEGDADKLPKTKVLQLELCQRLHNLPLRW